jgi:hypothetical protein
MIIHTRLILLFCAALSFKGVVPSRAVDNDTCHSWYPPWLRASTRQAVKLVWGSQHTTVHLRQFMAPVSPTENSSAALGHGGDLTGLQMWYSAIPLLVFLQSEFEDWPSANIIELGSGTGLLGIGLAAVLPQTHVVLTDPGIELLQSENDDSGSTLDRLLTNIEENRALTGARTSAERLLWGDEDHITSISRKHKAPFDAIVGSDLLYDERQFPGLLSTIKALGGQGTMAYLAYKTRCASCEAGFVRAAIESGFDVETLIPPEHEIRLAGKGDVRILVLTNKT